MVKSQLITEIANKQYNLSVKDVELSVNQLLECMALNLSRGKRIEIRGFGSFSLHYRPERNAHNPKTGEKVATIPKYSPHFKPGKELRDNINKQYGKPMVHVQEEDEEAMA